MPLGKSPPLSKIETACCILVVIVVAVLSMIFGNQGPKVFTKSVIVIWYRVFLGLWLSGLTIQVWLRRWRMNGILMTCVLISLFLWAWSGIAFYNLHEHF